MVRRGTLVCFLALGSCDQFALVGVREADVEDSGTPSTPAPQSGAAAPIDRDADVPDAAGADAAAECPAVDVAVCDPVANEGCSATLAMQCAIDQLSTLTGYCIFSAPTSMFGGECLNTGVTESCPATSTCYLGICHKICLCDADCDTGQCCTDPIESTGFSVCRDC